MTLPPLELPPLKAGDSVFFVSNRNLRIGSNSGELYGVLKIGRKWATLTNGTKVHPTTLREAGEGYEGRYFRSKADVAEWHRKKAAWRELWRFSGDPPLAIPAGEIEGFINRLKDAYALQVVDD